MKSYRLREFNKPLEPEEHPAPSPQGSEVLLEVVASGICHTDLHLCEGGYDLGRGTRLSLLDRGVRLPITLGHETVGRVIATGPDASQLDSEKTYLIFPWIGCGTCEVCVEGNENFCLKPRFLGILRDGGYADHILVPHARYLLDVSGLDYRSAAPYACSGVTAYSSLKKTMPFLLTEPIVLFGAGGLGLMCIGLLKALGGIGAVVVDIDEKKRQAAMAAGALAAIDGASADASEQIIRAVGKSPRALIDFVASEQTTQLAFTCAAKGGKIIIVGLFGGAAPWSLPLLTMKAITIQGNYLGTLSELKELLTLVREKNIPAIPIATDTMANVNERLHNLRGGNILGRVVLTP